MTREPPPSTLSVAGPMSRDAGPAHGTSPAARADAQGPAIAARPLRACMLAYTFYEGDGRVMRYAQALVGSGAQVDAIVLGRPGQPACETIAGVRVLRIQRREKNERGKLAYFSRIARFFFRSMGEMARRHSQAPYDLVHVHSVPDFEVFAALWPRLRGARVILDIHDIVPEFYAAKFGVGERSIAARGLRAMERWSARFAHHVIIANDLWLEKIVARAAPREKVSAFINSPDLALFDPSLRTRVPGDGRFVMSYPGSLNHHQGLDIALRAFAIARREVPAMEFHIHGEGPARAQLAALIDELGLQDAAWLHAPRPQREIARLMADADLGVVPKRNDAFGGDAFSTKILEFMAAGVPVVVSRTRIDSHYFDESLVRFFTPEDVEGLARAMVDAARDIAGTRARTERGLAHAREQGWNTRQVRYLDLVRKLVHATPR
jgi:glycosyltransferase involved in cell wall biosynthesis